MFEEILTRLVTAKVRFVVIGGVAATIQGSARFTNDLDICYDPSPGNVERLVTLLRSWHAYLRGVEPGLPFMLDARTFRTTPVMTLTTDVGDIDLFDDVAGVGSFDAVRQAAELAQVGKVRFYSLGLEGLIASKRTVRRPKDVEQLVEYEALLALRQEQRSAEGSAKHPKGR